MKIFLKQYINGLMRDKENGFPAVFFKLLLFIVSVPYAFFIRIHDFLYKTKMLKIHDAGIPVISVGNITLGGTGKTPFVLMLARHLSHAGKKCAILIRGYGEDEWKMLESSLRSKEAHVFVGRDRVKSAEKAKQEGKDIIILDDGFQHRRLKRDLDIVLVDSSEPFGNRRSFPRGILREGLWALKRADIISLTKIDKGKKNVKSIKSEIQKIAPGKPVLETLHRTVNFTELKSEKPLALSAIAGKSAHLVCAICDPSYFEYSVLSLGAQITGKSVFPDHYDYSEADVSDIFKICREKGADTIITTEKDAVKILPILKNAAPDLKILVLNIELEITQGKELLYAGLDSHKLN